MTPKAPTSGFETITPAIAAGLLKKNQCNRHPKPLKIDAYARDMARGAWDVNAETIVISRTGNLLDGQNRCFASVKSGASFDTLVARGIADEARKTKDIGAKRSIPDQLVMENGITGDLARAVAIARAMLMTRQTYRPSDTEIREYTEKHIDLLLDAAQIVSPIMRSRAPKFDGGAGLYGAAYIYLSGIHHEDAKRFFHSFATGAMIDTDSPIFAARSAFALKKDAKAVSKTNNRQTLLDSYKLICIAWNKWRDDEPCKVLKQRKGVVTPH
jgi:hypothetical protein